MLAQGEATPKASATLGSVGTGSEAPEGRQSLSRRFLSPLRGLFFFPLRYPGLRGVFDPRSTLG